MSYSYGGRRGLDETKSYILLPPDEEREFAESLLGEELFLFDPKGRIRTEHTGKERHFVDFMHPLITGNYDAFGKLCARMADAIKRKGFNEEAVSGVQHQGALVAYEVARNLGRPYAPRPEIRGYDRHQTFRSYLLIDDVFSSGQSIEDCVKDTRRAGWPIRNVVAFYDKELGARERLEELGIQTWALVSFSTLMDVAAERGYSFDEVESMRRRHAELFDVRLSEGRLTSEAGVMIRNALENPKYRWRTITGISADTGMDEKAIRNYLKRAEFPVVTTKGKSGKTYYTTKWHYETNTRTRHKILSGITGKLV